MRGLLLNVVLPFLTGFCVGLTFGLGLYLLDIGGLWSLVNGSATRAHLLLELIRFACAFGVLWIATHCGIGLVSEG